MKQRVVAAVVLLICVLGGFFSGDYAIDLLGAASGKKTNKDLNQTLCMDPETENFVSLPACKSEQIEVKDTEALASLIAPYLEGAAVTESSSTNSQGSIGPKGEPGEVGAIGATGPTGFEGQTGATGKKGPTGDIGPEGDKGPRGDKGHRGATGPIGDKGPSGITGLAGAKGPTGSTGDPGPVGDRGDTGATGLPGDKGPRGNYGEFTIGKLFTHQTQRTLTLAYQQNAKVDAICPWGATAIQGSCTHSGSSDTLGFLESYPFHYLSQNFDGWRCTFTNATKGTTKTVSAITHVICAEPRK